MTKPSLDSNTEVSSPPASPVDEKRQHRRHELVARCWLVDGRHTLYVRIHDLSRGGLSVRVPVPFAPAAPVDLGLELPEGRWVRARGEVVWVRPDGRACGARMGARFLELIEGADELDNLLGHA